MDEFVIIGLSVCLLALFAIKGIKGGLKFFIVICARFVFAGLLLYGFNAFLGKYGVYIPINIYTLIFSGLLGLPGVVALVILQKNIG